MRSFTDSTELIQNGPALAERREPRARSVLQRIVARDPDGAKRARAQALLDLLDR